MPVPKKGPSRRSPPAWPATTCRLSRFPLGREQLRAAVHAFPTMEEEMRVDYAKAFPAGYEAMLGLEAALQHSGLEPLLLELVKVRASQLNGCAYCLDMHSKDARARGEDEQRLHLLAAWREAPFYSARERAALAWCEALTLLSQTGAPDDVYAEIEAQFSPEEIAALTFQIVAINGWNRLAAGLRTPAGDYVSPYRAAVGAST